MYTHLQQPTIISLSRGAQVKVVQKTIWEQYKNTGMLNKYLLLKINFIEAELYISSFKTRVKYISKIKLCYWELIAESTPSMT